MKFQKCYNPFLRSNQTIIMRVRLVLLLTMVILALVAEATCDGAACTAEINYKRDPSDCSAYTV